MKKIEAIVRPDKSDIIQVALEDMGCGGMTITEVKGHGRQKGIEEVWRGRKYRVNLLPKLKLEVIVTDDKADEGIKTIMGEAVTKSVGDGKIFVSDVNTAFRIRTGEKGDVALSVAQ
ncbi:MAG: P-II family nitrogen regulator [Candidatus Anammoxibacter sp.]